MGKEKLQIALTDKTWQEHRLGNEYQMDGNADKWKIAYYPIFKNGKTGATYEEPRALVEKPIAGGIDFREVPLRYLRIYCKNNQNDPNSTTTPTS